MATIVCSVALLVATLMLAVWVTAGPPKRDRERMILHLLDRCGYQGGTKGCELYGLELVEQSMGVLSRGLIYIDLGSMEERGLVASREENTVVSREIRMPRRLYRITPAGLANLAGRPRAVAG